MNLELYYLWLQNIANKNSKFNYALYKKHSEDILKIYLFNEVNVKLDKTILNLMLDANNINEAKKLYDEIRALNLDIITIENKEYPKSLLLEENIPFCYVTNSNVNLNNKNIFIYYNKYFTKLAINLLQYFAKIIYEEGANVYTEYNLKNVKKADVISSNFFNDVKSVNKEAVILPSIKYEKIFKTNIIDAIIVIEARYEEKIVNIVDIMMEYGKDIYAVPANIFRKNSYFSNYLIQQGANVILNKNDVKFMLSSIIY